MIVTFVTTKLVQRSEELLGLGGTVSVGASVDTYFLADGVVNQVEGGLVVAPFKMAFDDGRGREDPRVAAAK